MPRSHTGRVRRALTHRWWILGCLFAALLGRAAITLAAPPPPRPAITIGSKAFTENRLLAEIMAQLIETHTDLSVDRRLNLGGTAIVFAALRNADSVAADRLPWKR